MRKELKSKSRRKWVIGGSLAFASVALLTTGFATWVIGTQQTSGEGEVHIGVDTVEDKSVELTFELDKTNDTIFVAENAGTSNSNLTIEQAGTPDWDIKIKNLNIVVGKTFYDSLNAKKVAGQDLDLKIVFALKKDAAADGDKNLVTEDKVGVRGGQTESSWNYIRLAKSEFSVTLSDSYPAGGMIYDINDTPNIPDKTFSFDWGSYFNGDDPSKFYHDNEKNRGSQTLREYYQKASQELQAMNTALNKGELKLTATFVYPKVGE